MYSFSIVSLSPEETALLADAVAPMLHPGDAIMLKGALAAGKTYFVQALVRALGSSDIVTSPTFTIAHFYQTGAGQFLHIDAYRLADLAEFRDLGLDEYFDDSITAVEWGDKVESEFLDCLSIQFDPAGTDASRRQITVSSSGERWEPDLARLRDAMVRCVV